MELITHWAGISAIVIFLLAYTLVILEENIHLKKSKPVMVAAGVIWILAAIAYAGLDRAAEAEELLEHAILEFAELFLFLLAAMTFINTIQERGVFALLRVWLVNQQYTLRTIFWITGGLAFCISPLADNLTTALVMAMVIITVGGDNHRFVALGCINIVVAANAGGAFSPFGDITTLMVWQAGLVQFSEFFALVVPSVVNWVVTASIMSFAVPNTRPETSSVESANLQYGAWVVVGLFILTIIMAVSVHSFLHMPPVLGMMTGLGLLKLYGYVLQIRDQNAYSELVRGSPLSITVQRDTKLSAEKNFYDIYKNLRQVEWDTLMFFYGVILCVAGLGAFGYLALASELMYTDLGATTTNILVGVISAIIDNIPVMFAVLGMNPEMSLGQWLLVTLTAGVGGSMLSIGSAAGVAVMGQAHGKYTFFSHLKWTWAIALGYAASIAVHFLINADTFTN
ncbi:MAG: sodium:proton antiporter NhaD [Gammaproteobacteria bacterium]